MKKVVAAMLMPFVSSFALANANVGNSMDSNSVVDPTQVDQAPVLGDQAGEQIDEQLMFIIDGQPTAIDDQTSDVGGMMSMVPRPGGGGHGGGGHGGGGHGGGWHPGGGHGGGGHGGGWHPGGGHGGGGHGGGWHPGGGHGGGWGHGHGGWGGRRGWGGYRWGRGHRGFGRRGWWWPGWGAYPGYACYAGDAGGFTYAGTDDMSALFSCQMNSDSQGCYFLGCD